MGHSDELRERLEELYKLHQEKGLDDEGMDQVFRLALTALTERDVLRGKMLDFLNQVVNDRTSAIMAERQL